MLGDTRNLALFDKWTADLRPVALDPRLSVAAIGGLIEVAADIVCLIGGIQAWSGRKTVR